MKTTQEYFNMSVEELQEIRNEYEYTREECLLLDAAFTTQFYTDEKAAIYGAKWAEKQGYTITMLKMTDDRIAVLAD